MNNGLMVYCWHRIVNLQMFSDSVKRSFQAVSMVHLEIGLLNLFIQTVYNMIDQTTLLWFTYINNFSAVCVILPYSMLKERKIINRNMKSLYYLGDI